MAKVKAKARIREGRKPKVIISDSIKLCEICGKVPTHRLVDGVRTCTACFESKI